MPPEGGDQERARDQHRARRAERRPSRFTRALAARLAPLRARQLPRLLALALPPLPLQLHLLAAAPPPAARHLAHLAHPLHPTHPPGPAPQALRRALLPRAPRRHGLAPLLLRLPREQPAHPVRRRAGRLRRRQEAVRRLEGAREGHGGYYALRAGHAGGGRPKLYQ